jgi:GAF domain-containing protein
LVIPVVNGAGRLLGVLDIDSDQPAAFDQTDADNLMELLNTVFADVG